MLFNNILSLGSNIVSLPIPSNGLHTWLRSGFGTTVRDDSGTLWLVSKTSQDTTGRTFSQATETRQHIVVPSHASFNSQEVLNTNTGFNGTVLTSDEIASVWDFLVNGSGCTIYEVFLATQHVNNSRRFATSNNSFVDHFDGAFDTTGRPRMILRNGGSFSIDVTTTNSLSLDVSYASVTRLQSAASPHLSFKINGEHVTADASIGFPVAAAEPLSISCVAASTSLQFSGRQADFIVYNKIHSESEETAVWNYINETFAPDVMWTI